MSIPVYYRFRPIPTYRLCRFILAWRCNVIMKNIEYQRPFWQCAILVERIIWQDIGFVDVKNNAHSDRNGTYCDKHWLALQRCPGAHFCKAKKNVSFYGKWRQVPGNSDKWHSEKLLCKTVQLKEKDIYIYTFAQRLTATNHNVWHNHSKMQVKFGWFVVIQEHYPEVWTWKNRACSEISEFYW